MVRERGNRKKDGGSGSGPPSRRGSSDSASSKDSRDSFRTSVSSSADVRVKKTTSKVLKEKAVPVSKHTPHHDGGDGASSESSSPVEKGRNQNGKIKVGPKGIAKKSASLTEAAAAEATNGVQRSAIPQPAQSRLPDKMQADARAVGAKAEPTSVSPPPTDTASAKINGGSRLSSSGMSPVEVSKSESSNGSSSSSSSARSSKKPTPTNGMSPVGKESPAARSENEDLTNPSKGPPARNMKREPVLYSHLPDATEEATSSFEVIERSIYMNKWIGNSDQDPDTMVCECKPDFAGDMNEACGDDSDCINRLTLMECSNDCCGCQRSCRNQRFQNREYADVSVFKAGNKGYGLRADSDILPGRFIYEYVGDVIDEPRFRQRSAKYAQEGVKHFYFMSLEKDQFIDATKKGGLARFVNHSCNPNCETEKWVVGKKFRMGIFAKRHIKAGEELVFDYNVDRYGAEKQPCYCGEPNCLGYIGGKTQTDSAPKLSENLIAALGIDDEDEMMPTKKNRRPRKTGEDDGDYMAKVASRPLTYKDVAKVMGTLQNTKERWIISRLLLRIQGCDDDEVFARVLQFHGYGIIGKFLTSYKDDETIVTAILDIFMAFPKLTKNKITAANIESIVEELAVSVNDDICHKANNLLEEWSTLQTMYRIPRRLAGEGEGDAATAVYLDRGRSLSQPESPESPAKPKEPSLPPWLANKQKKQQVFDKQPPKGPRAERFGNQSFHKTPRSNKFFGRPNPNNPNMIQLPVQSQVDSLRQKDLPWGWYRCYQFNECYYYSNDGLASWEIPTTPAVSRLLPKTIPVPPPKPAQLSDVQIILQEMKERAEKEERLEMEKKRKQEEDEERERQERRARRKAKEKEKEGKLVYDAEKTKRYLNISFRKHVPNMVNRFHRDLGSTSESAKRNVKRYSKEIVELLVDKEMRYHKTVVDPINVCEPEGKQQKVRVFVEEYMKKVIDKRKRAAAARQREDAGSASPAGKRKRESGDEEEMDGVAENGDSKRFKSPSTDEGLGISIDSAAAAATATPVGVGSPRKRAGSVGCGSPKRRRSLDAVDA